MMSREKRKKKELEETPRVLTLKKTHRLVAGS
jgi:hypothetical protein